MQIQSSLMLKATHVTLSTVTHTSVIQFPLICLDCEDL